MGGKSCNCTLHFPNVLCLLGSKYSLSINPSLSSCRGETGQTLLPSCKRQGQAGQGADRAKTRTLNWTPLQQSTKWTQGSAHPSPGEVSFSPWYTSFLQLFLLTHPFAHQRGLPCSPKQWLQPHPYYHSFFFKWFRILCVSHQQTLFISGSLGCDAPQSHVALLYLCRTVEL